MSKAIVGMPIKAIKCHAGLILNGLAVTSLHHADHKCKMTATSFGVHVELEKMDRRPAAKVLITWANIYYAELFEDEK